MLNNTFAPWPSFTEEEADMVKNVLLSNKVNYWTGCEGREFEKEFSSACGVKHAIAVANGTVALELALIALGIGPGDEVVTTSRTFIATASAIVMRGATPIFADVDPVSQNITADTIQAVLTPATKAIIAVHLAGWPCDMDPVLALAKEHGLKVIEDCAQAHGACYKGRPVGSLGDVGAFSFCQDKIMTTGGEGGMLVINDSDLWDKAWAFKDHGKSYAAVYNQEHPPGFRWLHESFGTNWRLTEMQSAIGRIQLRRLPQWIESRRCFATLLNESLTELSALRLTVPPSDVFHSYYKYYVFVRPDRLKSEWTRDSIIAAINAEGVPCFSGSCSEVYRERAFGAKWQGSFLPLPVARMLGDTALMFLVHPTLNQSNIEKTSIVIKEVMNAATK